MVQILKEYFDLAVINVKHGPRKLILQKLMKQGFTSSVIAASKEITIS